MLDDKLNVQIRLVMNKKNVLFAKLVDDLRALMLRMVIFVSKHKDYS